VREWSRFEQGCLCGAAPRRKATGFPGPICSALAKTVRVAIVDLHIGVDGVRIRALAPGDQYLIGGGLMVVWGGACERASILAQVGDSPDAFSAGRLSRMLSLPNCLLHGELTRVSFERWQHAHA